jgi:hypothetical protein
MPFRVVTQGRDPLHLRALLERFANDQWLPEHVDASEQRRIVLDAFRRQILHDFELLEIVDDDASNAG